MYVPVLCANVCVCAFGMYVCVPVECVCVYTGEKQREGGFLPCQLCAEGTPWRTSVEGHGGFPWQARERPDDCKRVSSKLRHTHTQKPLYLTHTLTHTEHSHHQPHSSAHACTVHSILHMQIQWRADKSNDLTPLPLPSSSTLSFPMFIPRSSLVSPSLVSPAQLAAPPPLSVSYRPPLLIHPQICVGKNEDTDEYLRLSSGKKKGLVPSKYLLEI